METWLTYQPRDFLLFSQETYWRLFERLNAAWWPLPVVTTLLVLALAGLAVRGPRRVGLLVGLALAASWVFTAEAFLHALYEPINWAVAAVRPAFLLEAVVLALLPFRLTLVATGARRIAGIVLVTLAAAYPLVGLSAGRALGASEVPGLAPDPTAIATLGLLVLARPGWAVAAAAVVPVVWLIVSAVTLLTMGATTGWVPLACAVAAAGTMIWSGFARPAREASA